LDYGVTAFSSLDIKTNLDPVCAILAWVLQFPSIGGYRLWLTIGRLALLDAFLVM
jgi:hypothetical protein